MYQFCRFVGCVLDRRSDVPQKIIGVGVGCWHGTGGGAICTRPGTAGANGAARAQKVNSFATTGSAGGRAGKWFLWRY